MREGKSGTSSSQFVCFISITKCTGQIRRHISIMDVNCEKVNHGSLSTYDSPLLKIT